MQPNTDFIAIFAALSAGFGVAMIFRKKRGRTLIMYKNIVIAYDDSEFSKAALLESSCWIKRHGGKAILVHSVFFDEEEFALSTRTRGSNVLNWEKSYVIRFRQHVSAEFGLNGNLESMICEGEPHDVLMDVAAARNADLIAIGTHGRKGLKKLFLGSVTGRVLVSSPCDVLVVKKKLGKCTGKFESVLLSFDGSEFSRKALGARLRTGKTRRLRDNGCLCDSEI